MEMKLGIKKGRKTINILDTRFTSLPKNPGPEHSMMTFILCCCFKLGPIMLCSLYFGGALGPILFPMHSCEDFIIN